MKVHMVPILSWPCLGAGLQPGSFVFDGSSIVLTIFLTLLVSTTAELLSHAQAIAKAGLLILYALKMAWRLVRALSDFHRARDER